MNDEFNTASSHDYNMVNKHEKWRGGVVNSLQWAYGGWWCFGAAVRDDDDDYAEKNNSSSIFQWEKRWKVESREKSMRPETRVVLLYLVRSTRPITLCTENSKSQTFAEKWQASVPCGFEVRPSFCVTSVCSVSFSGSVQLYEKLYLLWWVGQARPFIWCRGDVQGDSASAVCRLPSVSVGFFCFVNEWKLVDGVDWNELWLGKAPSQAERKIRDGLEDYGGRTLRQGKQGAHSCMFNYTEILLQEINFAIFNQFFIK